MTGPDNAHQLYLAVVDDKGELKFSALAPDLKKSDKLSSSDFHKIVHLHGTTEDAGETRLLVAFDDKKEGDLALDFAVRTARPGDHIFLCQVLEIQKSDLAYLEDGRKLQRMNDVALGVLSDKAAALAAKGVACSASIAHGEPKHALLALADFHKVDAIVLGRRKLGRLQKLIAPGSVSSYVLTHANQTVTIVKS